jgi:hypothetical protein
VKVAKFKTIVALNTFHGAGSSKNFELVNSIYGIIKQVASNESTLLLKTQK